MSSIDEREALESLIDHPGWTLVCAHITKLYDQEFLNHIEMVYGRADLDDKQVVSLGKQIAAVRIAVRGIIEWPHRRLLQLQPSHDNVVPIPSRLS